MSTNDKQDVDLNNEDEEVVETEESTETEETEEETTQEKKTEKQTESPEARKARLDRQQEQLKKKHPELYQTESKAAPSKKSDDFDYGEKAYLTANGIKGSKETDFVKKELKASGESLDSLLENDYFQQKLEKFRSMNKTSDATIKGKRSGGVATDSVEYWASKPIEEVPQAMRSKVVNFKLEKEKTKGVFYDS